MEAISLTLSIFADSVDILLDSFNSEVKNGINDIAPIIVSKKTNRQKSVSQSQIPSEMLSDCKCNEFASFFSEKIINIRKAISTSSSNAEVRQIRLQYQKDTVYFEAIDSNILEDIVQQLKSSTCYLDTLPTSFFKNDAAHPERCCQDSD